MNKRINFHIGLSILLAVFLFGCAAAGKKHYDTGLQLSSAGKYTEAIAYLQQAIEKEPNNKEYQKALTDIKSNLIANYVTAGSEALGSESPVTIGAINRAKDKLAKAQEIDPEHADVANLAARIAKQQDVLLSEVKALYTGAKQQIDAGDWIKAYFNLRQIQSRFPNYEDSFQLLRQAVDQGSQASYQQAKELFDREDFAGAGEHLRKTLALKGDHGPARELLNLVQERDNKDYFVRQAREAVMAQKWDRAVKTYQRALAYEPDNNTLRKLIGLVRTKAGEFYVRKSRSQMDDGWLLKGFESFSLAKKYMNAQSDFQLNTLKKDLTSRAAYTAENFKEQGLFGGAWFWYGKIQSIDPDYPKLFFLTQAMEDNIQQRVQKSIAVFDFNSPSNNADAGIIVANNLITYLFKNASGDIKILERENLKSILEEMKLGQIGVVSGNTAKQMGSVYGIDVAIMGSVLLYNVDATSSEGTKSVRYKVGTKIDDNIDYLNWKARNPKPTPMQLSKAPPAKITIPVYTEKDYKVSKHKKVGFVQLSFRIVDVSTGENIQVKTIEAKETVEDETSAGLPEAKIKFDPLEIPTDTEILQKMTEKVVADLGREALSPLKNLETKSFQDGAKLLRRRANLKAAESFIDAIFDEKMKRVQGSPLSSKAQEHLEYIFLNYKVRIGG
ncbi:MAG: CsgG/HfaB family protein [Candidatus Desulfatibia sp.]|uniref:CsgG/HfaB family protein n=1 Tax=Candidatus Desulfatibia sp. TaxID=3101189 RepID=UPI002F33B9D7